MEINSTFPDCREYNKHNFGFILSSNLISFVSVKEVNHLANSKNLSSGCEVLTQQFKERLLDLFQTNRVKL